MHVMNTVFVSGSIIQNPGGEDARATAREHNPGYAQVLGLHEWWKLVPLAGMGLKRRVDFTWRWLFSLDSKFARSGTMSILFLMLAQIPKDNVCDCAFTASLPTGAALCGQ